MEEPEHEWSTLHNASDLAQSFDAPPGYVDVPAPAYDDPDFALSPNTMDTLEQFLAMQPNISLVNGEWVMNYDAVKDNNLWQGTISPSLINEKVTKPSDDDDNDDARAALPDEELLAKVLNDSSDEEEECLTYDIVKYHLWVGFNIRYMLVPNLNDYIYLTIQVRVIEYRTARKISFREPAFSVASRGNPARSYRFYRAFPPLYHAL
jgi:hypothetical protein